MRVATYSRVSTSHHDQNPQVQVEELRRYCSQRGWAVPECLELIDHGHSGASTTRPALTKLMELARTKQIDVIVCVKLDRLFRSLKHLVTTLDELQELGIVFIAIRDAVDYSSPSGRLLVQVLGSLAEFEKSLLRERTKAGLEYARSKGVKLGRPTATNPFQIRELRAAGYTYRAIAAQLKCSTSTVRQAIISAT